MVDRRTFIGGAAAAALSGCAKAPQVAQYAGPPVTQVEVRKSARVMYVWSGRTVLRAFPVELGFEPDGTKRFEGDGRTPEGRYIIDRRNPESDYYLSLGISYPNEEDIEFARRQGRAPGGDIFIHGAGTTWLNRDKKRSGDWTAGCIALSNPDMETLWEMVPLGTPITIRA